MARDPLDTVMKVAAVGAISIIGAKVVAPDDGSIPFGAGPRKAGEALLKAFNLGTRSASAAANAAGAAPARPTVQAPVPTSGGSMRVKPFDEANYVGAYGSGYYVLVINGQYVNGPQGQIWAVKEQAEAEYNRRRAY